MTIAIKNTLEDSINHRWRFHEDYLLMTMSHWTCRLACVSKNDLLFDPLRVKLNMGITVVFSMYKGIILVLWKWVFFEVEPIAKLMLVESSMFVRRRVSLKEVGILKRGWVSLNILFREIGFWNPRGGHHYLYLRASHGHNTKCKVDIIWML